MFSEYIKKNSSNFVLRELSPESQWWEARRLRYNIGLVVAGILAFIAYVAVLSTFGDIILSSDNSENDAFTIFTLLFQGIGYLFMIIVANICYFLGELSERSIRPRNVDAYRRVAYALGFWFSVGLPFMVPVLLAYLAIFHPQAWRQDMNR